MVGCLIVEIKGRLLLGSVIDAVAKQCSTTHDILDNGIDKNLEFSVL